MQYDQHIKEWIVHGPLMLVGDYLMVCGEEALAVAMQCINERLTWQCVANTMTWRNPASHEHGSGHKRP